MAFDRRFLTAPTAPGALGGERQRYRGQQQASRGEAVWGAAPFWDSLALAATVKADLLWVTGTARSPSPAQTGRVLDEHGTF